MPNNILPKYNTMKTGASRLFKIRHISTLKILKTKNRTFGICKTGTKNYVYLHRHIIAISLQ